MKTQLITFCTVTASLLFPISAQAASLHYGFSPMTGGWSYGYYDNNGDFVNQTEGLWGSLSPTGGSLTLTGQNSPTSFVRRWESNFDGEVSLDLLINHNLTSSGTNQFKRQIVLHNDAFSQALITEDGDSFVTGSSEYKEGRVEVTRNSIIDFIFTPQNNNWSGDFEMTANISAHPGLVFLESSTGSNSFDHLGLLFNGMVYEANPTVGKVQATPLEQFISGASGNVLPHQTLALPIWKAQTMFNYIKEQIGRDATDYQILINPVDQKGKQNAPFTNTGLIEAGAEEAIPDQGFINNPDEFEQWNCLYTNKYDQDICEMVTGGLPLEINDYFTNAQSTLSKFLTGTIENADFILTDPLGRTMGYNSDSGFFNYIPYVYHSISSGLQTDSESSIDSNTPQQTYNGGTLLATQGYIAPASSNTQTSSYCSDNNSDSRIDIDQILNFSIANRLDGEYTIELFPYDENAEAIFDGKSYKTDRSKCLPDKQIIPPITPPKNPTASTPEPSSVIGILLTVLLGGWLRKKSRVGE